MNNVGSQAADIVRDGDVTTADDVAFTSGAAPGVEYSHGRKVQGSSILSDQGNVMALNYRFEKNRRLVLITGLGVIGPDEIVANREALLSDPDFDRSFDALVDFTQVPETSLNSDALRTLSREPLFSRGSRIAVVTTLPPENMTLFGMARLYETYREVSNMGDHLRVFRTLEDAREWLGVDEPPSQERLGSTG